MEMGIMLELSIQRCRSITCLDIRTSKIFEFESSKSLCWFFLMIPRQTIWGALEKNIRLGFRKVCVIPEWFALLLIKNKKHNKRFGKFKFKYFRSYDVTNKLIINIWNEVKSLVCMNLNLWFQTKKHLHIQDM